MPAATFEVLIPLRNAPEVLAKTAESLAAQTDRHFSILVSDNFSTTGQANIERALDLFARAGINARLTRPPFELGRVEHWNWLHYESSAQWLKPLFAGDWLEHGYIASLRAALAAHEQCRYVFANYTYHRVGEPPRQHNNPLQGRYYSPREAQDIVMRLGMQFGPPSVAAYQRDAFAAVGGYPADLPICADNLFFCTLAANFGALGLAEMLCHFNIHGARFSTNLPALQRQTYRETFTYFGLLASQAWDDRFAFSKAGFMRLLARHLRGQWLGI